jgi:hypothetical protein
LAEFAAMVRPTIMAEEAEVRQLEGKVKGRKEKD